jgi:hypothetical protein
MSMPFQSPGCAASLLCSDCGADLSAGVTIVVDGHEGGGTAVRRRALASQAGDLVVLVDLVVLEDGK